MKSSGLQATPFIFPIKVEMRRSSRWIKKECGIYNINSHVVAWQIFPHIYTALHKTFISQHPLYINKDTFVLVEKGGSA